MTKEEAIKWVKFVHDVLYEDKDEDIRTALDMAISALSAEPSDLISRAEAIEAVAEEWLSEASAESPYVNDDDYGAYKKLAEELFADIPSADIPIPQDLTTEQWDKYIEECRLLRETLSADRPTMIPINIEKRYPMSRDEDITDAFTRGYEYGIKSDRPSGEWIDDKPNLRSAFAKQYRCSNCGARHFNYTYCPSCGAYMKGGTK